MVKCSCASGSCQGPALDLTGGPGLAATRPVPMTASCPFHYLLLPPRLMIHVSAYY